MKRVLGSLMPSEAERVIFREVVGNTILVSARIFFRLRLYTLVRAWNIRDEQRPPVCVEELYGYSIRCRRPDRVVMCLRVIRGSQLRTLVFLEPIRLPDKSTARQCPVIVSTFTRFFGSCLGFSGDRFSRSFVVNR